MRPSQHDAAGAAGAADADVDGPDDEHGVYSLGDLIEDDDDSRPTRRSRRARQRRRRNPFGAILAILVVVALGIGVFFVVRNMFSGIGDVPDYTGSGTSDVQIRVNAGDSISTIAGTLQDKGVVKSARAFVNAAKDNDGASGIQPGLYAMKKQMKASSALDLILKPGTRLVNKVVVPEGFTTTQTLAAISKSTKIPLDQLQAAMKDVPNLGLPKWAATAVPGPFGYVEGVLAPGTYEFDPTVDATNALQQMVSNFGKVTTDAGVESGAAAVGRTPMEIVTIASMIEREKASDAEAPKIARVIYNRIAQNRPLQIDATTAFSLGKKGNELTVTDLQSTANPYNTRAVGGIPPGAIGAPSEVSLKAALQPAEGNWLFYVLETPNSHFFTADQAEFDQKAAECKAKGLCG